MEKIVDAVNEIVVRADNGYVGVLSALATLMQANPFAVTQKAGKLVKELADVLDGYLSDGQEEDNEDEE